MRILASLPSAFVTLLLLNIVSQALAQTGESADYVTGQPNDQSIAWKLSAGGRLYDNWAMALGKELPSRTHPSWPKSNTKKSGADTWRCKSCHGWDYEGVSGNYAEGDYATGIKGVVGVMGKDPTEIVGILTDSTHQFSDELIPPNAKALLALFLANGLDTTRSFVNKDGVVSGDPSRGKEIYQNVCAACHGYDGKTLNWGNEKQPAFVGTEANANPWEVFHKIRNGHPGHNMVSLRFLDTSEAANVLKYVQSLPTN